ncbi:MAG: hypothetical protein ABIO30_02075 [Thermomonas sp.]
MVGARCAQRLLDYYAMLDRLVAAKAALHAWLQRVGDIRIRLPA